MGQSNQELSKITIAELLTTKRSLSPDEIKVLQSALTDIGLYTGELDGAAKMETGKAITEFLNDAKNKALIPFVNETGKNAVELYSSNLRYANGDDAAHKNPIGKFLEDKGIVKKTEYPDDTFWGKKHTDTYNSVAADIKPVDYYLQNGASTKQDMENFQRALGMKKSDIDGEMGAKTIAAVTAYLKEEPNKFMSLGPQVLRTLIAMQSNNDYAGKTTDFKNLALNMPQYFARIDDLVAEIDKTGGLKDDPNAPPSAAAYTLQMMLKAGGLLDATPTGVIGKETLAAIEKSETAKETMIRQQGTREVDASATETAKPVAEPTIR
ncbi:MAG: hypothetical protein WBK77_02565 [Alphaproteobacteria bacterium]